MRWKKHLRPLAMAIEFSSTAADSHWLTALRWMKGCFSRQQKKKNGVRSWLTLFLLANKCGSADNVERCAVRITPKIVCITSDGSQLTEDKVETLCECKDDDVDSIENEPNLVINPIKPLLLLPKLPVPMLLPIIR